MKKNYRRLINKNYRIENVIKKKGDKWYVKWQGYDNSFNSWIDKKDLVGLYKMSRYFPKPYKPFSRGINVIIMQQKQVLNISHVNTSSFALKTNLANLKTDADKLDIDKLVPVPVDLSKLSDLVKYDVVKKLYMVN